MAILTDRRIPGGSWATGYDLITRTVFVCPVHGAVPSSHLVAVMRGPYELVWAHVGCGRITERVVEEPVPAADEGEGP